VTGSEIRWDAATSVGEDPEGRKLMLSGLRSFLGAAGILLVLSWACSSVIWLLSSSLFSAVFGIKSNDKVDEELPLDHLGQNIRRRRVVRLWTFCAVALTVGIRLVRPQVPYSHMSGSLPFTFLRALRSKSEPHQLGEQDFPLSELIGEEYWEAPRGHFKGWAPGGGDRIGTNERPEWASRFLPHGFQRWMNTLEQMDDSEEGYETRQWKNSYKPANDPLRITNLDQSVMAPIARAIKDHDIPINHVFLVMMESARKDIFPFKADSRLHHEILSSYHNPDPATVQHVNSKLSHLTPVAEQLTGESSGFHNSLVRFDASWKDRAETGMGGININGVLTGSSLSFKSAVMNHCGVGPIPVDFMDEVKAKIYQPCIMQIFDLFNQLKEDPAHNHGSLSEIEVIQERNWTSVFLQSITGLYDDQDILNNQMGFKKAIYREEISRPSAKHYHPGMEEINYFGYVTDWNAHENLDDVPDEIRSEIPNISQLRRTRGVSLPTGYRQRGH
jgi:hypothetical protein